MYRKAVIHKRLHCPHCNTEAAGFFGDAYMQGDSRINSWLLLLRCGVCNEGAVAKYQSMHFPQWVQSNGQLPPPKLLGIWPEEEQLKAPEHLTDKVERLYLQGVSSLDRSEYDAAGTMFRKCLDSALKQVHPEGRGNLKERIDKLPEALGVTPAMKQWAHEIRDLGNDAAHEEELFTGEQAAELHAFTEMFLTYSFTLPKMLEQRKEAKASKAAEA